jgi:copper chaperone NosL
MPEKIQSIIFIAFVVMIAGCSFQPEPIKIGTDNCSFCKMTISDPRFGAEIITAKGRTYKFDDTHCILSFLQSQMLLQREIKEIYLTDFVNEHSLIKVNEAFLFKSDVLKSPMNGNVAVFNSKESMQKIIGQFNGTVVKWNDLLK